MVMKIIQLLVIAFSFVSFNVKGWSQICDNIVPISGSDQTLSPNPTCQDSAVVFTYWFSDSSLDMNGYSQRWMSYNQGLGSNAFQIAIYGPFNTLEEGCTSYSGSLIQTFSSIFDANLGLSVISTGMSLYTANKFYILKISSNNCRDSWKSSYTNIKRTPPEIDTVSCQDCIPKFNPPAGKYVVSAWVKEVNSSTNTNSVYTTSYSHSKIEVYTGGSAPTNTFYPVGNIIDGWQKIEGIFDIQQQGGFSLKLRTDNGWKAYFDDIRIQPFNSSLITYVYDPLTLKLIAELDERNYAKLYEYDEEGKLIRIKKETEKGIMTIQETRENTHH